MSSKMEYGYYDNLRRNASPVRRAGSVDVFVDPESEEEVGICHIYSPVWFYGGVYDANSLAAILLAVHHFNTGNGSIAPALDGIHSQCPVRLTLEFDDTEGSELKAVSFLSEKIGVANENTVGNVSPPCAVLGPTRSASCMPMALLSSANHVPQMSFESTSSGLNDRDIYPFFTRVIPADDVTAEASFQYLRGLGIRHCAILYLDDAYGIAYLRKFRETSQSSGMAIADVSYPPSYNRNDIKHAITEIKRTGYRYIFGIIYPEHSDDILEEAARQGIAGKDHVWIMGTDAMYNATIDRDSLLDAAYHGVGFVEFAPNRIRHKEDKFRSEWRHIGDEAKSYFVQTLRSHIEVSVDTFTPENTLSWSLVAYDTVVAMGLAACNATKGDDYFSGAELNDNILSSDFNGASGRVGINETSGSRSLGTSRFEVLNLRRQVTEGGKSYFETVPSVTLHYENSGNDWIVTQNNPFIYASGNTTRPPDLPPINGGDGVDMNYIGNLRFMGYILYSLVAVMSIGFAAWTVIKRKARVVKASQPIFLIMICSGVFIMSSSMLTLSIDDELFTQGVCDFACMATPWLLYTGYATSISALFSKTWRINRVLNNPNRFKRVKVEVKDVIAPFVIFVAANMIILICWSVAAPLKFVRTINREGVDEFGRSISSYGKCTAGSDHSTDTTAFGVSLGVLNFVIVSFTTYQAYRARNISTDYSESKYIGMCIVSQLQALIIGCPIILLMRSDEASHLSAFLVGSLIIFVLSTAILMLMFGPKIYIHRKEEKEKKRKLQTTEAISEGHDGLRFHVHKPVHFKNDPSETNENKGTGINPLLTSLIAEGSMAV